MRRTSLIGCVLFGLSALLVARNTQAATPGGLYVFVNFEVFDSANCSVNVLQARIDFAEVRTDEINGREGARKIPYQIICKNPSQSPALKLKFFGTTGFNAEVLQTSTSNLGVRFLVNGKRQPLNSEFSVNYASVPTLEAVLDAKPGSVLRPGAFTANAVLVITQE
ncbi:fimbrial protein [Pseudomonas protegens]|uniref:fimbrial protein n=1 Tax=Pseudomonas protegens TaxID=380021 RepID=UPI0027548A6A|nr:fimbrial protein [Pseudomonas protegens]MDP9513538.1 fimbrial protein [Pseudomonas protegens]